VVWTANFSEPAGFRVHPNLVVHPGFALLKSISQFSGKLRSKEAIEWVWFSVNSLL
jgi:hypothetical protein